MIQYDEKEIAKTLISEASEIQLGDEWKFMAKVFHINVAQIFGDIFDYFGKRHF